MAEQQYINAAVSSIKMMKLVYKDIASKLDLNPDQKTTVNYEIDIFDVFADYIKLQGFQLSYREISNDMRICNRILRRIQQFSGEVTENETHHP